MIRTRDLKTSVWLLSGLCAIGLLEFAVITFQEWCRHFSLRTLLCIVIMLSVPSLNV